MKKTNIIIAICLIGACLIGWVSMATQKASETSEYTSWIKEADAWVEKGLYQRAIVNYNQALEEKPTKELYEKISYAYQLRYEEAPEETLNEYMDFLEKAVEIYPAHGEFVDALVLFYYMESKYEAMYNCLLQAVDNGYNTDEIQAMLLNARYAFSLRSSEFYKIKPSLNNTYIVESKNGWNIYNIEEGFLLSSDYEYIGPCSKDGIVVVTGKDSRILDSAGMVLGIFEDKVTEAGVFSEGLIPACCNGKYAYYNDLGEKQFGDYEMAGMFQEGKAAVKQEGKWFLIDESGKVQSDVYEEIKLDQMGRYSIDDTILVKKSKGEYVLFTDEWKEKATINCEELDINTSDNLIAFCQEGKWGYIDSYGEVKIKPNYEQAKSFSNGIAAVCKDGRWGFIDKENHLVIDYQFTDVGYMEETGLCPARTDVPDVVNSEIKEMVSGEAISEEEITKSNPESESEVAAVWKLLKLEIGIVED